MKRKFQKFNIIAFSFLLVIGGWMGCKKDVDIFIPQVGPLPLEEGNIDQFFNKVMPQSQFFALQKEESTIVRTEYGTRIHVPSDLKLVNAQGQPVSGAIELEVVEIYDKGDMILANRPTIAANGQVLNSGGELFLNFTQDGQTLSLDADQQILIEIPADDFIDEMELFYGGFSQFDSTFAWIEADLNPDTWNNVNIGEWLDDSLSQVWISGYSFLTERLQWINCDAFTNSGSELTEVCIQLPDGYDLQNTAGFVVFENINSVINLNYVFCRPQLPIGETASIITITERGEGNYEIAQQSITVEENMTVTLTPELISIENLLALLSEL